LITLRGKQQKELEEWQKELKREEEREARELKERLQV